MSDKIEVIKCYRVGSYVVYGGKGEGVVIQNKNAGLDHHLNTVEANGLVSAIIGIIGKDRLTTIPS